MDKQTPGPWYVNSSVESTSGLPGRTVHNVFNRYGRFCHVAQCGNVDDAHFIAAAPETAAERDRLRETSAELLAALDRMVNYVAAHTIPEEQFKHWPDIAKASAAIAKARGQA